MDARMIEAGKEAAFPHWHYDELLPEGYAAIYLAMKAVDPEWVDTLRALSAMTRKAAGHAPPNPE